MKKVGVILLNMGGPDSLGSVEPFLCNLFSDPDIFALPPRLQKNLAKVIAKLRSKKVKKYYEQIGGKSPLTEQTYDQAKALQKALGDKYKVVVGMRYWHPFIKEALEELFKDDDNLEKIILLPLYPQYSTTTTLSAFNEFERVYETFNKNIPVVKINSFSSDPLYIKAMVENIKENLPNYEEYYFLFSAHSLPVERIAKGDPYRRETQETVLRIMEFFPTVDYSLGYQSKIGFTKWLTPATDELIKSLAEHGIKKLALIPVSFVSEHIETLYEMDIQYKYLAKKFGIKDFKRIPTLRTHPLFIEALKNKIISLT